MPDPWQGMRPPGTKYETASEVRDSIPAGTQSYSLEYGPRGHAYPLVLNNRPTRLEIQFSCRVTNPYKALFEGNEFALNFLPAKFMSQSRGILEKYSLKKLRDDRTKIAKEIEEQLTALFDKFGFKLEGVTIGAVESVPSMKGTGRGQAGTTIQELNIMTDRSINIGGDVSRGALKSATEGRFKTGQCLDASYTSFS